MCIRDSDGNAETDPYWYTPLPPSTPNANACNGVFTTPLAVKKLVSIAQPPFGAKYDATYVVFAVIATGDEKLACCQPLPDSPVNVTDANNDPDEPGRLRAHVELRVVDG